MPGLVTRRHACTVFTLERCCRHRRQRWSTQPRCGVGMPTLKRLCDRRTSIAPYIACSHPCASVRRDKGTTSIDWSLHLSKTSGPERWHLESTRSTTSADVTDRRHSAPRCGTEVASHFAGRWTGSASERHQSAAWTRQRTGGVILSIRARYHSCVPDERVPARWAGAIPTLHLPCGGDLRLARVSQL